MKILFLVFRRVQAFQLATDLNVVEIVTTIYVRKFHANDSHPILKFWKYK